MRNLILSGSRSKTNEKGRVEDNYLVQVSTCWFLLLIREPSPRNARAVPLLVSTLISTDQNRRRRSSRRHDQFSQNLCSNLPLNLSRSNLEFCGMWERKWWLKTLGSEKIIWINLKTKSELHIYRHCWLCTVVRHDAPYGPSWRTVHFSVYVHSVMTHHIVRHDAQNTFLFMYIPSWRTILCVMTHSSFSVSFPIYANSSKLILKPYFLSNSLLD